MRPGALPLDVDGYPVAPPELELEQVHLYIRHGASSSPISWRVVVLIQMSTNFRSGPSGERTPVRIRMAEPPASVPESWMLCHTARKFDAAVSSNSTTGRNEGLPLLKVVEREDGSTATGEW